MTIWYVKDQDPGVHTTDFTDPAPDLAFSSVADEMPTKTGFSLRFSLIRYGTFWSYGTFASGQKEVKIVEIKVFLGFSYFSYACWWKDPAPDPDSDPDPDPYK